MAMTQAPDTTAGTVTGAASAPDFFVVGAPKCATSSLHLLLRRHPDVFMCSPKEPHFFATDMPGLTDITERAAYDALFDAAPEGTLRGEASASYLRSAVAAANIHAANPEARIVISIRNPVDAVESWYHQMRDLFREDQTSLEAAWDLQDARARGERLPAYCPVPQLLQYADIYRYHDQIERFFAEFGRERVLVLRVEHIKADPAGTAATLAAFLGLAPFDAEAAMPSTNARREVMYPGLTQLLAAPPPILRPLMMPVKRALNAMGVKPSVFVMRRLSRPAAKKAPMDPALRRKIAAAFADDIPRLETLLDMDLSAWKTPG